MLKTRIKEYREKAAPGGKPEAWGKFAALSQLPASGAGFFARLIFPAAELARLAGDCPVPPEKVLSALPRFTFDEAACQPLLRELWGLGFRALYCESGAHIQLAKESGLPFALYGGPYLNLTNPEALSEAARAGRSALPSSPRIFSTVSIWAAAPSAS